tara:strand:+ start:1448 stop:1627 length:180 start_codon:yes stop_codon:yes gene_type:complete
MPSPKDCASKFPVGSKEFKDCVAYKGQFANKGSKAPLRKRASNVKNPLGRSPMSKRSIY